ncbi:mechanosensitive ion channel family protein [Patescibacteria group bacterium]|nr:mechanosensitive ion channel family protein [Patescibacteria group bacterium]
MLGKNIIQRQLSALEQYQLVGNTLKDFLLAIIAFGVFLGLFKWFQRFVLKRLKRIAKRTKTDIDDALIQIVQSLKPPFYSFLAFYLALQFLTISGFLKKAINLILIVWVVYQAIIAVQIFIDYLVKKGLGKEKEKGTKTAISLIGKISKGVLWVIGVLLILSNLGVNVTSLIAGLGIGGVAVALALQNVLSDLFSSFAIYFDKPFVPGDFIIVGKHKGVVEKIGIKTTRIRALQGEEIVFSNQELTSARIQNFKKMKERRATFSFGVTYETPTSKLKKIPKIVKEIIESVESTRFDRVHFTEFGDSALLFEVIYYLKTPDYLKYRDAHQEILFKIKNTFEKQEISMAYPTQTIYLNK